jgi:hypothetical protein
MSSQELGFQEEANSPWDVVFHPSLPSEQPFLCPRRQGPVVAQGKMTVASRGFPYGQLIEGERT